MKKIVATLLLSLMVTFAFATGIEGTWTTNMEGQNGSMELTFVFKMEGGKLTGSIVTPNGDMPISNAVVNGKEFSFNVEFNEMSIKHNCTLVDDDNITMKVEGAPMGDGAPMLLKRKK